MRGYADKIRFGETWPPRFLRTPPGQRGLTDRGLPAHVVIGDDTWTVPAPALLAVHLARPSAFPLE